MPNTLDPPAAKPAPALLLVNPASGGGAGRPPRGALDRLQADGVAVTVGTPRSREEIGGLIEAHRAGIDCVIVAGGDGTLNAAADPLLRSGLPLGILPTG